MARVSTIVTVLGISMRILIGFARVRILTAIGIPLALVMLISLCSVLRIVGLLIVTSLIRLMRCRILRILLILRTVVLSSLGLNRCWRR